MARQLKAGLALLHGKTRYILEYIPKADVQAFAEKHRAELEAGASVWDLADPDHFTKEREARSEQEAFEMAKRLVPLDDYGEVHVFRQTTRPLGAHTEWVTEKRAVVWADDKEFDWT